MDPRLRLRPRVVRAEEGPLERTAEDPDTCEWAMPDVEVEVAAVVPARRYAQRQQPSVARAEDRDAVAVRAGGETAELNACPRDRPPKIAVEDGDLDAARDRRRLVDRRQARQAR
jgi:hypothetical protein